MAALSPEETRAAMEAAAPDLKYLLDREGVTEPIQASIFHAGFTTMRQFGAMAERAEELRKVAKADFEIDPEGNLAKRVLLSKLVVAWESAKVRSTKLAEAEADSEVRQDSKPMKGTDFIAIRKAYEAKVVEVAELRGSGQGVRGEDRRRD